MILPTVVKILKGERREHAMARKDRLVRMGLLMTIEEIRREEEKRKAKAMEMVEKALGSYEDRPL